MLLRAVFRLRDTGNRQGMSHELQLVVNGERVELTVDTRTTLLDALREQLGLTGAKKGCDHGQCGACTILVDGQRVQQLPRARRRASTAREIVTVEGLADGDGLHPVQQAFVDLDAFPVRLLHPGPDLLGGRRCCTRWPKGRPSAVTP